MAYVELPPHPTLSSLVACYWGSSGPREEHRVLPDGCIDIVLLEGEPRVVGAMTRAILAPAGRRSAFGVRFLPGEAARLLREAPRELSDEQAPLALLWGAGADALSALAEEELPFVDRARALDSVLRARLASHAEAVDLRVRAAASVLSSGGSVREAAARARLSERQLSRRFTERVGVAPKLFARVMRLQRAAGALGRGSSVGAAATLAGYADQAHFTRDSRDLARATPSALASELLEAQPALAS